MFSYFLLVTVLVDELDFFLFFVFFLFLVVLFFFLVFLVFFFLVFLLEFLGVLVEEVVDEELVFGGEYLAGHEGVLDLLGLVVEFVVGLLDVVDHLVVIFGALDDANLVVGRGSYNLANLAALLIFSSIRMFSSLKMSSRVIFSFSSRVSSWALKGCQNRPKLKSAWGEEKILEKHNERAIK